MRYMLKTDSDIIIIKNYNEILKPLGWYIHGRFNKQTIKDQQFIQLTQDINTAIHYAGDRGSIWILKPKNKALVLDARRRKEIMEIGKGLFSDFIEYILPYELENNIKFFLSNYNIVNFEDEIDEKYIYEFIKYMNPKDIVDSAGLWDSISFVNWFYETYEIDWVYTNNGAICLNIEEDIIEIEKLK